MSAVRFDQDREVVRWFDPDRVAVAWFDRDLAAPAGGVTHQASIAFSAAGTFTLAATVQRAAAVAATGAGTLSAAATVQRAASIQQAGAGTFAPAATVQRAAAISFLGEGFFSAAGEIIPGGGQEEESPEEEVFVPVATTQDAVWLIQRDREPLPVPARVPVQHQASIAFYVEATFNARATIIPGPRLNDLDEAIAALLLVET